MRKIAIIMGSESDKPVVEEALPFLEFFEIKPELFILSAHRTPQQVQEFATSAEKNKFELIIACAGLAAHLPGVVAAYTKLPVIGVPLEAGPLKGQDALYSIVQMPAGVPVATMAIGKAGIKNAAIFAAQIIGRYDGTVSTKLDAFKQNKCRIPQ